MIVRKTSGRAATWSLEIPRKVVFRWRAVTAAVAADEFLGQVHGLGGGPAVAARVERPAGPETIDDSIAQGKAAAMAALEQRQLAARLVS